MDTAIINLVVPEPLKAFAESQTRRLGFGDVNEYISSLLIRDHNETRLAAEKAAALAPKPPVLAEELADTDVLDPR